MMAPEVTIIDSLEYLPNFLLVNSDGRIVYINDKYTRLLGTTQAQSVGKLAKDIIPNTRMHLLLEKGEDEVGSIMRFYDHQQGKEVILVCNRFIIRNEGKIVGAVAFTTLNDLDEINQLKHELIKIQIENEVIKEKLSLLKSNPIDKIVGTSQAIKAIKQQILEYSSSNLPILLLGETGVGKEVFANAIHESSNRALNNFVKINCCAIPSDLLESELFGYEEGAFSGASRGGKIGKFELANKGTILLDEIGEMPINLQAKILRVLQENEVVKVGGSKTIELNTRLICSTNCNLTDLVRNKTFREDLYYRINVIEIHIPALRDRKDDIPSLCEVFIKEVNALEGLSVQGLSENALERLQAHYWPGNVRELKHVIQRAAVHCKEGVLKASHFSFMSNLDFTGYLQDTVSTLRTKKEQLEKSEIIQALEQAHGNRSKAAKALNIDRSLLYRKLKFYGIE